jgi:Icc-related predicted phosphoesterase
MRLLLFSDLHGDPAAARRVVERSRGVDVVVGAGDFGNMRRGVAECIAMLRDIDRPVVLVPGNAESVEELAAACREWPQANVLHGSGAAVGGIRFFGIGGGVPVTPFGAWSYDFTEEEAAALLAGCPPRGVLVSHSPPHGAADANSRGQHLGSHAVRDAVLQTRPRLVVCGHIHGSAGRTARIGSTAVVNAGPSGIEWELEE